MESWPFTRRASRVFSTPVGKTALWIALILVFGVTLVWSLDPALRASATASLLWRNALPVVLLALLFLALTGRLLVTAILTGGLMAAVFKVNAVKELNMDEPILPGDLVLRHQLANNLDFFAQYLGHSLWPWVLGVLAVFVLIRLWVAERRARLTTMLRIACAVIALAGLTTLFYGTSPWRQAYSDARMPGFPLWHPIEGVQRVGLMAGLVRLSQEARITVPKADTALVQKFADAHAPDLRARGDRVLPATLPDIVIVQSEAFFAPGVLKGVDFGQFAPNFAQLSQQGISGSLGTPAYGGGTIRTEFEVLTGYPVQAFPSIVYPYYGLADRWIPSVPTRLIGMGYETALFHPFEGSFWNRSQVMPMLGFQHTTYEPGFQAAERAGSYISDKALFDRVLQHLSSKTDTPQFTMAITMENHGPWGKDPAALADLLDGHPLPTGISDGARKELTYYLSHLSNGDRALGKFAQQLLARKKWTVLLFYGDHLPALPHAFAELGFDNGKPGPSQRTRYMLLSNRPLQPRSLDLAAHDLPGLLFDTIGLPEDGYLAIEAEVRHVLVQQQFRNAPGFGQIVFNAAQLEVACRKRLTLEATCSTGRESH